jgi:hypothetical protein
MQAQSKDASSFIGNFQSSHDHFGTSVQQSLSAMTLDNTRAIASSATTIASACSDIQNFNQKQVATSSTFAEAHTKALGVVSVSMQEGAAQSTESFSASQTTCVA